MQNIRVSTIKTNRWKGRNRMKFEKNIGKRIRLKMWGDSELIQVEICNVNKGDKILLTTTIDKCFMAGLAYYLGSQELGVGIIRTGPGNIKYQWDMIERFRPEIIIVVPSFLLKMIKFANFCVF